MMVNSRDQKSKKKRTKKGPSSFKTENGKPLERKGASKDDIANPRSYDVQRLKTLESYKRYIANVCTECIANPENGIEATSVLFDIVEMRGGGTEGLRSYVKDLALRSLVSVAIHLIPRISYELLEPSEQEDSSLEGKDANTTKRRENEQNKVKNKSTISSNLVETERNISRKVVHLRDRLVDYCAKHLQRDPGLIVPMIARLTSADAKPHMKLLRLCMECFKLEDEALTSVCLDSFKEVMNQISLSDLDKALKLILKANYIHAGVLRVINGIPIIKRQHSYDLLNDKGSSSGKYLEDILVAVIAYYLRILAQCSGETLDECLIGLGRYGVLVNEALQKEILQRMKEILQKATTLQPFTHVKMLQAATILSRSLNLKSQWIIQELCRMISTTVPYLCQGQAIKEREDHVQFSEPCYTLQIMKTIHAVLNHSISSSASSDMEDLVKFLQELLSLAVVSESAAGHGILQEVCRAIQKSPTLGGILDQEGIIFSVVSKTATSFWELELLLHHVCSEMVTLAKNLKQHNAKGTLERLQVAISTGKKSNTSRQDALCDSDVSEILLSEEADMFSLYRKEATTNIL